MSLLPREVVPDGSRRYVSARAEQMAALCWRQGEAGREVLLVTSTTGRWILPKGRPIRGKDGAATALTEAWEEAGVQLAKAGKKPIGRYMAAKRTLEGDDEGCRISVYAVEVRQLADDYPEVERRQRRWASLQEAADLVAEDGLREILLRFA